MMKSMRSVLVAALLVGATAASAATPPVRKAITPVTHTDAEWKALLPPLGYQVLRHAATETAFTGRWWNEHRRLLRSHQPGLWLYELHTSYHYSRDA